MTSLVRTFTTAVVILVGTGYCAQAAEGGSDRLPAPPSTVAVPSSAPAPLVVYFESGSSTLRAQDKSVLDRASRAYNEGKPIVMILTGTSDRVGKPELNLSLSQRRATAVLKGLLDRGIPADRFQVLAKGESELPVPTKSGISEAEDRRVEISWH